MTEFTPPRYKVVYKVIFEKVENFENELNRLVDESYYMEDSPNAISENGVIYLYAVMSKEIDLNPEPKSKVSIVQKSNDPDKVIPLKKK